MDSFPPEVIEAAKREREVTLTTYGRKTGKPHDVVIWIATDGTRLYIRSGQGLKRQWPQNFIACGEGLLRVGNVTVKVKPRLVTDPVEARASSELYRRKYGPFVKASKPNQPLTPGEQATFELLLLSRLHRQAADEPDDGVDPAVVVVDDDALVW